MSGSLVDIYLSVSWLYMHFSCGQLPAMNLKHSFEAFSALWWCGRDLFCPKATEKRISVQDRWPVDALLLSDRPSGCPQILWITDSSLFKNPCRTVNGPRKRTPGYLGLPLTLFRGWLPSSSMSLCFTASDTKFKSSSRGLSGTTNLWIKLQLDYQSTRTRITDSLLA